MDSAGVPNVLLMLGRRLDLLIGSFSHGDTAGLCIEGLLRPLGRLGSFVTEGNDCRMAGVLVEVCVQILQSAVGGLWVEKVDDKDEGEIEDSKYCDVGQ